MAPGVPAATGTTTRTAAVAGKQETVMDPSVLVVGATVGDRGRAIVTGIGLPDPGRAGGVETATAAQVAVGPVCKSTSLRRRHYETRLPDRTSC